jgi:two-component system chemotaxis sensor kinase CheA
MFRRLAFLGGVVPRSPFLHTSIQLKVFAVVAALTLGLVGLLAVYFSIRHVEAARGAIENKAMTYGRLVGIQLEPAVAFDDEEAAAEVFSATAADRDVRGLALFDARGKPIFARGAFRPPLVSPLRLVKASHQEATVGGARCYAPVVSKEGTRGSLVLELSTESVAVERARIQRAAIGIGCLALVFGFLGALGIGRSLAKRLGTIAVVTKAVANGDLSQKPIVVTSNDEVGQLARSFNSMLANIQTLVAQIRTSAAEEKERLDGLVAKRTQELDQRNGDMRLVLDHVRQGFITLDRKGVMSPERSAILQTWLGKSADPVTFWEYLSCRSVDAGDAFQIGWDALLDGYLPLELCVEQLPKRMTIEKRIYELEYTPICVAGEVSQLMLVISDVTSEIERERSEESQKELLQIFERVRHDKTAVAEFVHEADALVQRLEHAAESAADMGAIRHTIHTLKGNCGVFGLTGIARICHELESDIDENGALLRAERLRALFDRWTSFTTNLLPLLGEADDGSVDVAATDYELFKKRLGDGTSRAELLAMVSDWRLEPTSRRLARVAEQLHAVAKRLGKSVLVDVDSNELRLDPLHWSPFWSSFVHVVRNTLDHGIETPEERRLAGKSDSGHVRLCTRAEHNDFIVEIRDDGRGMDWQTIEAKARALGWPCETEADLTDALFRDGFSTSDQVTELSGRGVGMGALRKACQALEGRIEIESVQGQGTSLRCRFPWQKSRGMPSSVPPSHSVWRAAG